MLLTFEASAISYLSILIIVKQIKGDVIMVEIKLPYDKKTITAVIPDKNFAGLLESKAENYHNPFPKKKPWKKQLINPFVGKH